MLRAYPGLLPTTLFVHQRCSPILFQLSAREEAQSPAPQVSASPVFSSQLLGSVSTGWELELIPNATLKVTTFFQRKNGSFGTCTTGASDSNVRSIQDLKELNSMLRSMFIWHSLVSIPCDTSLLPASGWPGMSMLSPECPFMAGRSWCNASPFLSFFFFFCKSYKTYKNSLITGVQRSPSILSFHCFLITTSSGNMPCLPFFLNKIWFALHLSGGFPDFSFNS